MVPKKKWYCQELQGVLSPVRGPPDADGPPGALVLGVGHLLADLGEIAHNYGDQVGRHRGGGVEHPLGVIPGRRCRRLLRHVE